jgi:phosphate transport system substrate-binding protein
MCDLLKKEGVIMKKIFCALAILFFCTQGFAKSDNMIQVKGSDTMVNMVQILAEKYMAKNPGKAISVTGGGSGTGVAALLNDTCDIANSSRDLKDKERASSKSKIGEVVIAIDGLSIIVSKDNKIEKLTIEQLGKIYRGEITNWKDVGGANTPINLYGRQPNSGTYDFVREFVVKADYAKSVKEMNGNAQIVEAVKNSNQASGIGYVGAGYVKNAKDLKILKIAKTSKDEAYLPTHDNVLKGLYPIARPLFQFISGEIKTDTKAFLAYELSAEGQKIISEQGFYAISDKQKTANNTLLGLENEKVKPKKVKSAKVK